MDRLVGSVHGGLGLVIDGLQRPESIAEEPADNGIVRVGHHQIAPRRRQRVPERLELLGLRAGEGRREDLGVVVAHRSSSHDTDFLAVERRRQGDGVGVGDGAERAVLVIDLEAHSPMGVGVVDGELQPLAGVGVARGDERVVGIVEILPHVAHLANRPLAAIVDAQLVGAAPRLASVGGVDAVLHKDEVAELLPEGLHPLAELLGRLLSHRDVRTAVVAHVAVADGDEEAVALEELREVGVGHLAALEGELQPAVLSVDVRGVVAHHGVGT